MIDGKTERQDGIFIVQIKLNENQQRNNLAWKSNTDQVFHYDDIITIYGKEKQFDVFVDNQPYADTNRCKELEFLIENRLDLRLLSNDTITLVFQDSDVNANLEFILSTILIDGKTERQGGIFIVQIKLNENQQRNNLAWKGNIDQVFHYDDIITIYGKENNLIFLLIINHMLCIINNEKQS
ncbi:unnamed protein product [Rotaria sordida]|uniref:Uncharacterized protein n=1 Tax=Rotaria sordida TaxID=392033 RepID=A0A814QKD2_9BILA|nr:unnamed protein product [Rotaria sordida]